MMVRLCSVHRCEWTIVCVTNTRDIDADLISYNILTIFLHPNKDRPRNPHRQKRAGSWDNLVQCGAKRAYSRKKTKIHHYHTPLSYFIFV